ncbi:hydroxyisourate hydrolase [Occultella glacieicola]|uniref:5-hydroxyisourate hydrolase n=1 Tax=Occultella glacieicola TaxID=2518684 RepID=A0ABY2E795_9MICO|nr:hydroxyisourate hydrolase [Occultella glacieicola]TDE95919.1 hydroxyisourate hydrolase [Occultella glacieicola]
MSHVTTHVLDASAGRPAAGIAVLLEGRARGSGWSDVATGTTDDDGRVTDLGPDALPEGTYRLTFATGAYFDARGVDTFYPEVTVAFRVAGSDQHYHVPVLLSPFAYSTYRGS